MDIKQDEITTLHELCVDKKKLMKTVSDAATERPVSVIMPMLYKEIKNNALENIIDGLNKCKYLNEIIIPLAARNEKEFKQVKRFFSELKIQHLIMWCNGPKIEDLLTNLKNEGINLLKYPNSTKVKLSSTVKLLGLTRKGFLKMVGSCIRRIRVLVMKAR